MGKFDNLEQNLTKVTENAPLKNFNYKDTKNILVYNVPKQWSDILKANGIAFSAYAKMAILEKMKKDKLL